MSITVSKFNVVSLHDREVASSASDRQDFESCVWKAVSSHHPQEVILAQLSIYDHKGGLKPHAIIHQQIFTAFRSCASLPPLTTSSGWKVVIILQFKTGHLQILMLKLQNCFFLILFKLIHGEWCLMFLFYCSGYWVIKDLSLLFFNIVAPPKQTWSQRSKTYCLYNRDIKIPSGT